MGLRLQSDAVGITAAGAAAAATPAGPAGPAEANGAAAGGASGRSSFLCRRHRPTPPTTGDLRLVQEAMGQATPAATANSAIPA
jgi:hypothetical protein